MTATIMSPTPALPALRKTSVWEKMFSGFKIGGKKDDPIEIYEPMPTEQERHVSLSTGVDRNTLKVHKRTTSGTTRSEAYRRPSVAPSSKSYKTISSRAPSVCSTMSRRSTKKWWRSSNSEEKDLPPVPAIDMKFAAFGSHNPDFNSLSPPVSPGFPRQASYVPRNAAGSFLKSTTNPTMKKSVQEDLNEASRRLSAVSDSKPAPSSLKPIPIKAIELRRDSYAQPEMHGMYSMAGICDIIDEEQYNESLVSPTSINDTAERTDSAKGSLELIPTKSESDREPSLIEGITA